MSQSELLKTAVRGLEAAKIDYMLTGSVVSSMQGQPRATHDIDVVVAMQPSDVTAIQRIFPDPPFYMSESAIAQALKHCTQFNVIDTGSGDKIDFWMLTDSPFDQSRFSRKARQPLFGMPMLTSMPEDTILQKLAWAKQSGGSERQFNDAKAVLEIQHAALDLIYLNEWAQRLDISELWLRLKDEADSPSH